MTNANASHSQPGAAVDEPIPNGANSFARSPSSNTLAREVAFLQDFLPPHRPAEDSDEAGSNIAALLKQLDTADGVAQGVESKLDNVLSNLEGLLEVLESNVIGGAPEEGLSRDGLDAFKSVKPQQLSTHKKDVG